MLELIIKSLKVIPLYLRIDLFIFQLLLIFSTVIELLSVISIGPFIALATNLQYVHQNKYLYSLYIFLGQPTEKTFLIYSGGVFLLLFILSNGILLAIQIKLISLSNKLQANLSVNLFKYYISRNHLFHLEHRASILISKINTDIKRFSNGIVVSFLNINSRIFSIVILIGLLIVVNKYAALSIGISLIFIYIIIFYLVNKYLKKNGKKRTTTNREHSAVLLESFDGIKSIRFYEMHEKYTNRLQSVFDITVKLNVNDKLLTNLPYFVIESTAFLLVVIVVIISFSNSSSIEQSMGELSVICLAGYRLIPKFQQVYRDLAKIKSNHTVLDEIYDDICSSQQLDNCIEATDTTFTSASQLHKLKLENISFSYMKEEQLDLFSDVFFQIEPGELVGLVGKSGAGKSTLIYIMLGLLTPKNGLITYGENIINETNASAWRKQIGFVDSTTFIFNTTLLNNITLFDQQIDFPWLDTIINLSCLDELISELGEGINSHLENKGSKLSTGQLQRIGFARALYRKPSLLFLDEATNALDYETQQSVITQIRANFPNIAIVVISHRLDIRDNFDRYYLLESGKLKEFH